ncbi:universal stress protein UspA [Chromatiales bacterium (ex Bugula neritina AB1)]|nr:universal stress protein UspA [Chromatiales bacterium (ex Bugula neritina AB1)]
MKKILALIDGSKYSQSVCDHAAWMATRCQATLELLHVLGRREGAADTADLSGSIGLGARTALLEELAELDGQKARLINKRGRAILEDGAQRAADAGVQSISTTLRHGQLIRTLQEFENNADMICIGKRGEASNFDMEHLGSNLERVVRASHKPVLVASRGFQPVKRVLIAFDGGTSSIKAVERVAACKVFTGLECLVLTVVGDGRSPSKRLEGAVALLNDAGFKVESDVRRGQPETVIADAVEQEHFDLLVMGAYGHSRIRNLIIGSTTTQMVRSCKIPVILYR